MSIVNLLGEVLAKKTNKDPLVCRGLIRLAMNDKFGTGKRQYDLQEITAMCENELNKRLEKVNIKNAQDIINLLIKELQQNQSLLTMGII